MIVRVIRQKQSYRVHIEGHGEMTVKGLTVVHPFGRIDWNNTDFAFFDAKEVLVKGSDDAVIIV